MPPDPTDQPDGREALRLIDCLLAERPKRVGEDFSACTRALSRYRDALIARHRAGEPVADRLERTNAVLSVVISGHFPLGAVPWAHVESARTMLAEVLAGG